MTKNEYKTISLTHEAKKKLGDIGKKNETWSEVILRLIEGYQHDGSRDE